MPSVELLLLLKAVFLLGWLGNAVHLLNHLCSGGVLFLLSGFLKKLPVKRNPRTDNKVLSIKKYL